MKTKRSAISVRLLEQKIFSLLTLVSFLFFFSCQKEMVGNIIQKSSPSSLEKGILFYSDFESDIPSPSAPITGWSQQGPNADAVKISEEQAYSGSKSVKFTFNYNDWDGNNIVNGKRAEILMSPNPVCQKLVLGKVYWVGFSSFIPNDWANDYKNNFDIIWQFHSSKNGPGEGNPLEKTGGPPMYAVVSNDSIKIYVRPNIQNGTYLKKLATIPLIKGEWDKWIVQVKFDYNNGGIFQLWHNDSLIVSYLNQSTIYHTDWQKNEDGPYVKFGIYKSQWGNVPTKVKQRVIYYDDIIVGDSTTNYSIIRNKLRGNESIRK